MHRAIKLLRGCNELGTTSRMEKFFETIEAVTDCRLYHEKTSIFGNRREEFDQLAKASGK